MSTEKSRSELLSETRAMLSKLYADGGSNWPYRKIATLLNKATGRDMEPSDARRFVLNDRKQPQFSVLEAAQVHTAAQRELSDFQAKIRDASLPDVTVDFNSSAKRIDFSIQLESDQAGKLLMDHAFQEFLRRNIQSAVDLYLSLPNPDKGPA